jgi:threonine dehydratase
LKCELFQKTGSFKFRGASNAVFSLTEEAAAHGVCTHSSGNHAAALAAAATARGCKATVVMPSDAPVLKVAATAGYGATIVTCAPGGAARAASAAEIVARTGATFIHPSENPLVIAGQGTVVIELLKQAAAASVIARANGGGSEDDDDEAPALDVIVVPLGGGGLLSGCAIAARGIHPRIRVIGAEPLGLGGDGADAARSLAAQTLFLHTDANAPPLNTCADGLRTSLGPNTWSIIREFVPAIVPVQESTLLCALRDIWERTKLMIEPSAAIGIAAMHESSFLTALGPELVELSSRRSLRIGVILCGGNVDICQNAALIASVPRE